MNSKVLIIVEPEEVELLVSPQIQAPGNRKQRHTSFSCSGEQSSNDTVVWKGLLPVFGYSRKILPDTTWWKRWMGRNHIFYVVNTQVHELSKNPKSGLLSSQEHLLDQLVKFIWWKLMARMVLKLEFSSIRNPVDTSFIVISRETERFRHELHQLRREFRSSNELLKRRVQRRKGVRYEERKVTTSHKETWAAPSSWKQDADTIILTQSQEHLCTKWAIPRNEKKWITIPANYRR